MLELASAGRIEASGGARKEGRIRRKEQTYIDKVINGEISGEYLLLLGPKVSSFFGERSRGGSEPGSSRLWWLRRGLGRRRLLLKQW